MRESVPRRVTESGIFVWPWATPHGLAIVVGAAGGGGGGGGGAATTVRTGDKIHRAAGGSGGDGGLIDGSPVKGKDGKGCHYGVGGDGGHGAIAPRAEGRTVSDGGDGGKGFPGETRIVELQGLSRGDRFEIEIGIGGQSGGGGDGYKQGDTGASGNGGVVLFVPLPAEEGDD